MKPLIVLAMAGALGASCGEPPQETPPRRSAEQQRTVDSTIGASRLPGAGGVQGALRASDSAAARARRLDSLARTP